MVEWNELAKDFKMCVTIYKEAQAGRLLWFTRLSELLKDDMSKRDISMLEDKLQDIGVLYKEYARVGKWNACCYFIVDEAQSLIKNIVENLTYESATPDPKGGV